MNAPATTTPQSIDESAFVDLLEASKTIMSTDFGNTVVHHVSHPECGELLLSSSFTNGYSMAAPPPTLLH